LWKPPQESSGDKGKGSRLFSSHPNTEKRMSTMVEKVKKDGHEKPAVAAK
jgi:putative metalloprotease